MAEQPDTTHDPAPEPVPAYYSGPNNARWVVGAFVALIAAFVLYMALGMPGMDHGGGGMEGDMPGMDHGGGGSELPAPVRP